MLAIHCISPTVASSPRWIAGSATLMMEPSRNATLEPRIVTASTQRLAYAAQPGVSGAPRRTPASQGGRTTVTPSQPHYADRGLGAMPAVQVQEQGREMIQERRDG